MAVPSSGQLRLRADIANEVDGSATGVNVSLQALSRSAGKSTPDGMLEFYGYSAAVAPTVTTSGASSTDTTVYITGTVNSDGGATITSRGFFFGTSSNRASNPSYAVAGTTGNFNLNRTGLSPNTTYYYWAYATNERGTTYGAMSSRATYPTLNYAWASPPGNYNYGSANGWQLEASINTSRGVQGSITGFNRFYHPYLGAITYHSYNLGNAPYQQVETSSWKYAYYTGGNRGDFRTRVQSNFNYAYNTYKSEVSDNVWSTAGDGAFHWYKGGKPRDLGTSAGFTQEAVVGYSHTVTQGGMKWHDDPARPSGYYWMLIQSYSTAAQSYYGYGWMDVYK